MARGPGDDDTFPLSPRNRRIVGWVAAIVLIIGIAVGVRILGGNGDGTLVTPTPSGSGAASLPAISFGTALDPATGEVATDARRDRFSDGDLFAYSVPPAGTVPSAVYVEVLLAADPAAPPLQEAVGVQALPNPEVIAFTVPAAALLADFGPGEYLMRIYADPAGDPIAEGAFELVGAAGSPAASP